MNRDGVHALQRNLESFRSYPAVAPLPSEAPSLGYDLRSAHELPPSLRHKTHRDTLKVGAARCLVAGIQRCEGCEVPNKGLASNLISLEYKPRKEVNELTVLVPCLRATYVLIESLNRSG